MFKILRRCIGIHARKIPRIVVNSSRFACVICPKHDIRAFPSSAAVPIRCFSSEFSDEEGSEEDGESGLNTSDQEIRTRDLLYVDTAQWDETMRKLKECSSLPQVYAELEILRRNPEATKLEYFVQSLLTLWDIHKDLILNNIHSNYPHLLEYPLRPELEFLVGKLNESAEKFSSEELSCCLLYLTKLGFDGPPEITEKLHDHFLNLVATDSTGISLASLSRFAVYVNARRNLSIFSIYTILIPKLVYLLKSCSTSEEIRLLTICLGNLFHIITPHQLDLYRKKVNELYQQGAFSNSPRSILRVVNFLNFIHWCHDNTLLIRKLMLLLQNSIPEMETRDLVSLCRVFHSQLEPAQFLPGIVAQTRRLMEKNPTVDLLECFVLDAVPETRNRVTQEAEKIIKRDENLTPNTVSGFFKVLRFLKTSNMRLFNAYWAHVLRKVSTDEAERENYRLARHCHRYMHFNNNLGGTYRYINLERYLVQLILGELETGVSRFIPSKFAKIAPFVIAYGHTEKSREKLPDFLVERIETMRDQFSATDCLNLSRGIQIALELRFRNKISDELGSQLARIENVFHATAEKILAQKYVSLSEVNCLIRSFNARKASRTTDLFERLIRKYEESESDLNSRLIREITFNLNASVFHLPNICAKMVDYLMQNHEFIMGDTTEKILYCCYNIGYPIEEEEMLKKAADVIQRDFNFMTGLSIVQACLALAYYRALPQDLVDRVFCTDFIQRLEHEITLCYSKATYPTRVLHQVMQLNRAVCLDYPERNVPWFQQNFLESRVTAFNTPHSRFHEDVNEILHSLTTTREAVRTNHVTPYGYRVDFVLHFDHLQRLIPPPRADDPVKNVSKIALLLHSNEAFCENSTILRGNEQLKQRHLEILGYRVLHLAQSDWNSMYLSVPGAKSRFLRNLLSIT
ncbi:FAST kinase domain-containing protein 1, mitochondrial [Lutzomyia longipalpis]|uniref:FAST kinase domain-containing protein 1, mitochondrial n=1 Tax=Lutzomyia longipalpis TaxID=7200 RepID=UPI00248387D8|nr:FAST kinase domain-containing protein 1, mitochondrial [Lutzomyia longipalpis]